jgi:hypothetical protein
MNRLSVYLLFSSVVFAQQSPSASQVAGLEQDVAQVRMDVARLSEQTLSAQNWMLLLPHLPSR